MSLTEFAAGLTGLGWEDVPEADLYGVGIWIREGEDYAEELPPPVFRSSRVKPTHWQFHEDAYRQWLRCSEDPSARMAAAPDSPPGQLPLAYQWDDTAGRS